MSMTQERALDGSYLYGRVDQDTLESIFHPKLPRGLIGLDLETGLVKVALNNTGKVAYMKLGKLLRKLGCADDVVRNKSSELRAMLLLIKGAELSFTETSEEAYDVYEDGPHSCMAGHESVGAYATDSVSIAYVKAEGRILARTVVCTDEDIGLQYMCIYGNGDIMKPLLEAAGYVEGSLNGCTLLRLEGDYGLMCPYLDCGTNVSDCGDYLQVNICGEYSSQDINGMLGRRCGCCNELCSEDDVTYSDYREEDMCGSCFEDAHVTIGGTYYNIDDSNIVELHDGDYALTEDTAYSEHENGHYLYDDVTFSDYSEDYYLNEDVIEAVTDLDDIDRTEICCRDDCQIVFDTWVHDDIAVEYEELMKPQLELFEEVA